jgi:hypothetical protein
VLTERGLKLARYMGRETLEKRPIAAAQPVDVEKCRHGILHGGVGSRPPNLADERPCDGHRSSHNSGVHVARGLGSSTARRSRPRVGARCNEELRVTVLIATRRRWPDMQARQPRENSLQRFVQVCEL